MEKKESIIDRIWFIRRKARLIKESKDKESIRINAIEKQVDDYIHSEGLPPGYSSKEQLLQDIITIEKTPCAILVSGEYNEESYSDLNSFPL